MNKEITECTSRDGLTVGLIDSLITISSILRQRLKSYNDDYEKRYQNDEVDGNYIFPNVVEEALKDLESHKDIYLVLQAFGYNPNILSDKDRELLIQIDKTNELLNKKLITNE